MKLVSPITDLRFSKMMSSDASINLKMTNLDFKLMANHWHNR